MFVNGERERSYDRRAYVKRINSSSRAWNCYIFGGSARVQLCNCIESLIVLYLFFVCPCGMVRVRL